MLCPLPYVLALIAVCRASAENTTSAREINLPTPSIYGLSDYDDKTAILWLLDEDSDNVPVLGYKVRLWQVGCDKKPKYKYINGERVRLKHVMPRLRDLSTLQNLTEFVVEATDNTLHAEGARSGRVLLPDIEPDVPYHATVAVYGAGGEGPPSSPFRFQQRGRYTCREI